MLKSLISKKSLKYIIHSKPYLHQVIQRDKFKFYSTQKYDTEEALSRLHSMVRAFRTYGHFAATLDPLGIEKPIS